MPPELRESQKTAVDFLLRHGRAILADPPGAGKTATVAEELRIAHPERTLVVAPVPVLHHWMRELERWAGIEATLYRGTPKQRAKIRESIEAPYTLVMGYETFRGDIEHIGDVPWDAIVFDEAHRLKNRQAKQTKAAWQVTKKVPWITFATGTPVLNRAEELWSLLHMIDRKRWSSFWRWAEEHFIVETNNWIAPRPVKLIHGLKPDHVEEVASEVAEVMIQRNMEDLLDLPKLTENLIDVDLTPAERRNYDQLAEFFWTEVDGDTIVTQNHLAQMTRLQQLIDGWEESSSSKVDAAVDTIADLVADGEQAIVFTRYTNTAKRIAEALQKRKIAAETYIGSTPAEQRDLLVRRFQGGVGDKVEVIVATQAAMGEGVDGLQYAARHVVFVDRDWTPARNDQALGRLLRNGQNQPVVAHHIVARDTIDMVVWAANEAKVSVIRAVTGQTFKALVTGQVEIEENA